MVKSILSWGMIFAVINVITLCPLAAQMAPASSSCCSHSKGHEIPCTESTSRNCPYVLLEKAKSERGLAAFTIAGIATVLSAEFHPQSSASWPIKSEYYPDSSESYLSFRVLRL